MSLIKRDLKQLGISHDIFFSETEIVKKNLVNKAINKLKNKNFVEEGFLDPPKGESFQKLEKVKGLFSNLQNLEMTDRAKKMMVPGLILLTMLLIIQIKLIGNLIN